ncbi:MAG: methylmalonyl-CoA epimerase [candidate division Zixibacteria bacterium]|nr:methylmalonyl-CoA epimerase [candidate division Zixibacteria bacterium]
MSAPTISHLGIAVKDLDAAIRLWSLALGRGPSLVTEVADQKVKVAVFPAGPTGGGRIELVAPTSPDSPVSRFLATRGEGLHHVCIYVDDIEAHLRQFKSAGVRLIDETPRLGAEGHRIAFVHPSGMNGVLLELEERSGKL